jgi:hypothetical protein
MIARVVAVFNTHVSKAGRLEAQRLTVRFVEGGFSATTPSHGVRPMQQLVVFIACRLFPQRRHHGRVADAFVHVEVYKIEQPKFDGSLASARQLPREQLTALPLLTLVSQPTAKPTNVFIAPGVIRTGETSGQRTLNPSLFFEQGRRFCACPVGDFGAGVGKEPKGSLPPNGRFACM